MNFLKFHFPEAGGPKSIYIDPKNELDLENAIKNLLENEILRNSIAEKGLKFVQKFNDEIIARNYFEIYRELISKFFINESIPFFAKVILCFLLKLRMSLFIFQVSGVA